LKRVSSLLITPMSHAAHSLHGLDFIMPRLHSRNTL